MAPLMIVSRQTAAVLFIAIAGCLKLVAADCDVSCAAKIEEGDNAEYRKCLSECATLAAAIAAANGVVPSGPPPACYDDLTDCGLKGIPMTTEEASDLGEQISGCMFLKVAMKTLTKPCEAEVDAVGKDLIIDCVGIATALCGAPSTGEAAAAAHSSPHAGSTSELAAGLPPSVLCMAEKLPEIEMDDPQCAVLVSKFIQMEAYAEDAYKKGKHGLESNDPPVHNSGGGAGQGAAPAGPPPPGPSKSPDSTDEEVTALFGGLAIAVIAGAFCATVVMIKGCQMAKSKYGNLGQYEDALEMMDRTSTDKKSGSARNPFHDDDTDAFGDDFDQEEI